MIIRTLHMLIIANIGSTTDQYILCCCDFGIHPFILVRDCRYNNNSALRVLDMGTVYI